MVRFPAFPFLYITIMLFGLLVSPAVVANRSQTACEFDCLPGNGDVARRILSYSQLTGASPSALIDYQHYGLPANAASPTNYLEGSLSLTISPGTLVEHGTALKGQYQDPATLPPFDFQFVQHGSHVIPVTRQLVHTGHTTWEWLLLPGRVWDEKGDQGFSRVAIPFALQEINANCTHNGVLTFLFRGDGSVSNAHYQIGQETCSYFQFTLHGSAGIKYRPHAVEDAAGVRARYEQEVAARTPVKPLADLASDFPTAGIDISALTSDQDAAHLTSAGVYYRGVHYRQACETRLGTYPYCDQLALPSYSLAKTLVTGLGVMRAAQIYSPSIAGLTVSDYIAECDMPRWQDVTLLNALDMATGNYNDAAYARDESSEATIAGFFSQSTHAKKARFSCHYPRKAPPGSRFVYHTSDSYLAARLLQQFYADQQGAGADFFRDWLVNDIFKPLDLSPLSYHSKRTYDEESQVWGGYGLTLLGDDLVKLGRWLAEGQGRLRGEQVLSPQLYAEAMQQTDAAGLATGKHGRYQHGIWAYNAGHEGALNCRSPLWLPYMSGFGGIGVVMLPNQMVYYFVSDNHQHGFLTTLRELAKISPLCGSAASGS